MTVKEFAEKAEISLSLAYALIAEGRVPHRRIGQKGRRGCIRVTEEDYRVFIEDVKNKEMA
jgi:Helix-turn-helix domain